MREQSTTWSALPEVAPCPRVHFEAVPLLPLTRAPSISWNFAELLYVRQIEKDYPNEQLSLA